MLEKDKIKLILGVYAIIAIGTICFFNGVGREADSVMHYLFAKYAPSRPSLYFDHWAKPVYVLLASPFAQLGFVGIKIFNALVVLFTIYYSYQTALLLQLKNSLLLPILLIFTPLYYLLTFTGLTEPLYALFTIVSIYLFLKEKWIAALILVSFMPFVRSEGLIFIGVVALYTLLKNKWKLLPYLLTGHLFYCLLGFATKGDFLWVINEIPYASLNSVYGQGTMFHFVDQLIFVVGVPIYVLLVAGTLDFFIRLFRKTISLEMGVLVGFGFFSFFLAHTLFWYFGLFNSMGLKRVFVGIAPLMGILALNGFNLIMHYLSPKRELYSLGIQLAYLTWILVFPFTTNHAAVKWDWDMNLSTEQKEAQKAAEFIKKTNRTGALHFAHPYLSYALDLDYFDKEQHINLALSSIDALQANQLIVWDSWMALVENGIEEKALQQNPKLEQLYRSSIYEGREITFTVFRKK